ncbi:MAG TPA: heparinase II/III family protein [Verrucomicrobiae bacterium]|nr:heparinase II/III family protein [Verrucomicrobiae bacterium]
MNTKAVFIILTGVAFLAAGLSAAVQPLVVRGEHPRLFFTPEQMTRLRERIASEPSSARAWSNLLVRATKDLERGNPGLDSLEELGLAYRMTGDKRFALKARAVLSRECTQPNWGDPVLLRRDPSWHAGLGTAHSCFETAVAFDAIYDALSPDERKAIAKGIVDLGVLPTLDDWMLGETRIHALDSMGHNWWSACVFDAGIAALAVMDEEPRAQDWLARISGGSVEWFDFAGSRLDNKPRTFDPQGGFYESVNYASFALSQYLFFRLAWNHALAAPAPPEIPMLDRIGDFFINTSYPADDKVMSLNFGDGNLYADGSRPVALLWANGFHQPRLLWYLNQLRTAQYREGLDRTSPFGLVYFPGEAEMATKPAAPGLPPSNLYGDMGWATLRSSWNKNATLLAVKSGMTWNHSHADAGSFILFHDGENLLIDSGNCSYSRPEYDEYYRQSRAHNVVLFDGMAENPEDTYFGSKFPGTVSHLMDAGDLKYVLADATGPTSHLFIRNYRHFLWLGDVILIIDDLKTFEPGKFEWLLHVDGEAKRDGLDLTVTKRTAQVRVRPLFPRPFPNAGLPSDYPEDMRLVEKTGLKDHDPDAKVTYFAFAPSEQTRRTKFITAILLVNATNQNHLPQLERLTGENYIGVRVRQAGTTTDVYLNLQADGRIMHRNANLKVNGWETDACLTALTFAGDSDQGDPDAVSRCFIAQGSYLRRDDKVVLDSLSKVFLTAGDRQGTLNVLLQGQPTMDVRLRAASRPERVIVNGAACEVPYDARQQVIRITRPHD